MKIYFPRKLVNYNCILPIADQLSPIFSVSKNKITTLEYNLLKLHKISSLGTLIIYKILDYSSRKNRTREHNFIGNILFVESAFDFYGFTELFNSYFKSNRPKHDFTKYLRIKTQANLIIAPQSLNRTDIIGYNDHLQKVFVPALDNFYRTNPDGIKMIFTCISEIMANFWQHAIGDDNSLIVAEGCKDYIEISCVDTGIGIVSSMKQSNLFKPTCSKEKLLNKALVMGVRSKPNTDHMGYGLWIIDEITTRTNGVLHIHSQGVYYTNERGKKRTRTGGFWNGTILYLQLPLNNPVTHSQLFPTKETDSPSIKINFV